MNIQEAQQKIVAAAMALGYTVSGDEGTVYLEGETDVQNWPADASKILSQVFNTEVPVMGFGPGGRYDYPSWDAQLEGIWVGYQCGNEAAIQIDLSETKPEWIEDEDADDDEEEMLF
jgi:hypothetical protein